MDAAERNPPAQDAGRARSFFPWDAETLGIAKGEPFAPDARQGQLLEQGALVGEAMAKANTYDRRFANVKYCGDALWDHALNLDADYPAEYWGRLDEQASWFYEAYSATAIGEQEEQCENQLDNKAEPDPRSLWLEKKVATTKTLSLPIVYIQDERNSVNPPEASKDVANKFLGPFERMVLPGVGHFPQREDSDAVTQILIGLFSEA